MNENWFEELLESGDFLSGVYNYCDRWCERCRFNSRCLNYQSELSMNEKYPDDSWEGTLKKVAMIFEQISKMLDKIAEEEGIELTDDDEANQRENRIHDRVFEMPLIKRSVDYLTATHNWFKDNGELINNTLNELKTRAELGMESEFDPVDQILKLNDVIEIIMHYNAFINVKLSRAYADQFDDVFDREFSIEDMNLSAKLALIGIDRSLMGWQVMSEILALESSGEIEKIQSDLEILRTESESEFPDARKFERPYFDKEGMD